MKPLLLVPLLILCLALPGAAAMAEQHAVVLMYHHISADTPSTTSVTPERFQQHLDYLVQHGFVVLPLAEMLAAIYAGKTLPQKAVAITFDDAYESVFSHAWPLLSRRRMPFTVFVATDAIDNRYKGYMRWAQMHQMDPVLASFGAHSRTHAHLVERKKDESSKQWRTRVLAEIAGSVQRINAELGVEVESFAYPYGEYDGALMKLLLATGLYGLAQHSGAVGPRVNPQEVPRFPMATGYDDLARFATAINSRPMPASPTEPNATVITAAHIPQSFLLPFDRPLDRATELSCYGSGIRLPGTAVEGGYRIGLPKFQPGRNKINCTAPSRDQPGVYYWYSKLWILADQEGAWLRQ